MDVMTALIWTLTWLPQVLPAMSELPQPVILSLNSSRSGHILTWKHGPGTPSGVYYRVTVCTEMGTSWLPVAGCEYVQHPLLCNMTQAFSDQTQVYLTQVTALLDAQTSQAVTHRGFQPIKDAYLDLPLLSVMPCERNLCVDLQPPMEHLRDIYESFHYKLRVQSNSVETVQDTKFLRRETLDNLAPGREYCVSVCFSDSLVPRKSNYSQPVCAVTAASYNTDALISSMLCLLVVFGLVAVALLVAAGYICLRRPLPLVLTSIHHIDRTLSSRSTSSCSVLTVKPTAPSSGEERSNQTTAAQNHGEVVTGSTGGSGGENYTIKVDLNLLLSSSLSSLCVSAPLLPELEPTPRSSLYQTSDLVDSPPASAGMRSSAGWTTACDSLLESDCHVSDPPGDALTEGGIQPNKVEEEVVGDGSSRDVNLCTLTFSRSDKKEEEEEEEEDKSHDGGSCASEDTASVLPTQTWETEETVLEMVSCSVTEEEEEEEEEASGYIGHLNIFQNLS